MFHLNHGARAVILRVSRTGVCGGTSSEVRTRFAETSILIGGARCEE
jgi:hypothetical protein